MVDRDEVEGARFDLLEGLVDCDRVFDAEDMRPWNHDLGGLDIIELEDPPKEFQGRVRCGSYFDRCRQGGVDFGFGKHIPFFVTRDSHEQLCGVDGDLEYLEYWREEFSDEVKGFCAEFCDDRRVPVGYGFWGQFAEDHQHWGYDDDVEYNRGEFLGLLVPAYRENVDQLSGGLAGDDGAKQGEQVVDEDVSD